MTVVDYSIVRNPYYQKNVNPTDPRYLEYQRRGPRGMMLHSIGTPQPRAMVLVDSWNSPGYTRAAIHAFIDANTGTVYRTMPSNYRAPHAAGAATDTHIGVEMCEPDCIRYTSGSNFTCSDVPRAREMVTRTYESAVTFFAQECLEWGIDPMEPGAVISHAEGHTLGIASNHGDPEHLWKGLGMDYTMDGFRKDVHEKMIELNKGSSLRPGDKGEDVRQLQGVLTLAGYYDGELDGSYGPKTTQAVTDFQTANGLETDGKAGPATQAKLLSFDFIKKEVEKMSEPIYRTLEEIPDGEFRSTAAALMAANALNGRGDERGLDLTERDLRQLIIMRRYVDAVTAPALGGEIHDELGKIPGDEIIRPVEPPEPDIVG